jgi:phosphoglycerate kinase
MGRLFEEEFCVISGIMEKPEHPSVFVLGGTKINDAFLMMNAVLGNGAADQILSGGLVGEVLLWADGTDIGEGSRAFIKKEGYAGLVDSAKELLSKYRNKIVMPKDLAAVENGKRIECKPGSIPADTTILDIGTETAKQYQEIIRGAKTVFVNGPMGVFEEEATELGSRMIWEALGDTRAYTVLGGGDSITATKKFGKTKDVNYICTGGGALIRFLTGEELPVVKALRHGSKIKQKMM